MAQACPLLALLIVPIVIRMALCAEPDPDYCRGQPLEELIDDRGKWRAYDFVAGNCLAQRFIEQFKDNDTNIDIYSSLRKLEKLVARNLQLYKEQLEAVKDDANGLAKISKIKYDLRVTTVSRQTKRSALILNKMLEKMRVQVGLADNQINTAMEECLRAIEMANRNSGFPSKSSLNNGDGLKDKCSRRLGDTLAMVIALCGHLDAQSALQQLTPRILQLTQ